ncbi:MAG TPA: response regulator transcription factor [Streptosporangiaceae bacterium]|nr:response regulator transcription factor [Streptosporangiaceae bacterium]
MSSHEGWASPAPPHILVVDDEPHIRGLITRALEAAGYLIENASDGAAGLEKALANDYKLVILDLVMPVTDGRQVLTTLRRVRPEQPVLILSCLSDVTTKVGCLDSGADDYLTKPFSLDELLARVRVQLRGDHHVSEHDVMRTGHLVLDLGRMQADTGIGPVPLTRLEVLLLRELMEHSGESVTKVELLASVWGIDFDPGSNVVDVCVRRLRSKLGFELIETVRGAGYRLAS